MRVRAFFISLFGCTVALSALFSVSFLSKHHPISTPISLGFILFVCLAIILQMLAHIVRAYKSHFLLDQIRRTNTPALFQGLSVGYLFNGLLPLRLGEFIRAFYVGDALAISKTSVFMSIVVERVVDGLILGGAFMLGSLAIAPTSQSASVLIAKLGVGLFIVSLLLALAVHIVRVQHILLLRAVYSFTSIFNEKITNRLRFMAWSGIYGTRLMLSRRDVLTKYLISSIGMWVLYFCSTATIVFAFFNALSPAKIWFSIQASYAGISTPIGPGYIGSFYLIMSKLLSSINITETESFIVFTWFIIAIPISIVGLAVLVGRRLGQQHSTTRREILINKLYREQDVSAEFAHFLSAYFMGEQINQILTQAELDNTFKLVRSFRGGSNAHTMLVWQNQQLVVKKITLPQFSDKLQAQAEWLLERKHLQHIPRVLGQEKSEIYYSFDIEYREDFLPFFDFIHSHSTSANFDVVERMLRFMNKSIYNDSVETDGTENLQNYIQHKVLGKVNDTASISSVIGKLISYPKIQINGIHYDNMLQVIERLRHNKRAIAELACYQESAIHGDLTVDNLIVSDKGEFLVLDPNNENQVSAPVVDFGKFYQSLHSGYEFLIQLTNCQVSENRINFEDSRSHKYAELFQHVDNKLRKELPEKDYRSILFHEAVHYCRMLTYRANINPDTLPAFYATAVKLFNEYLAQYD